MDSISEIVGIISRGVTFTFGPLFVCAVASTRALYEKKLRRLLQAAGRDGHLNGEENGALFSDSEDEQEGANRGAV